MRLHLLEHDPFDYSRTNITLWADKKGHRLRQSYVCNMDELPALEDLDWLMVMGGSEHVWEEKTHPWLSTEKAFIKRAMEQGKIVLGVCFGAQLIAEILGAKVFPSRHKEIGWYEVALTREGRASFLFRSVPDTFVSFHWHSDHFFLPAACSRLAFSEAAPNQAFVRNDRPVVGVQFHPEYTLEMVKRFSDDEGGEWTPDLFVDGRDKVLAKTDLLPDTYWLMGMLLDNMEAEFGLC